MSTTWSIEHIPASGGASTFASLATWGFAGLRMQLVNWGVDQASITARGGSVAFDAAQFAYLDKIVVWRNGSRHSHWWIIGPALNAETKESRTYTLAGPAWWLEQTPFQHPQHVVNVTTDPDTNAATGCTWEMLHGTEVVWTSWPAQSSGSINGQINRALYCAIDNGSPIGIGAVSMPGLSAPVSGSGTCLSVMQQAARLLPRSACWWDSSGETPLFHASSLAGLDGETLTIGTHDIEAFGLQPRSDQRVDAVRVVYTYPSGSTTAAWFDNAGDDTLRDGPNTLRAVVECTTSAIAANAASHYGIAAQLYGALHETAWEGSVILHDTGAGLPTISLGARLSLAGGRSEWAAMSATIKQIEITITDSANDGMSITLGPPPPLGAQDIFEALNLLTRAGAGAVSTSGGTSEPAAPAPDGPVPGAYDDLNGGTGGGAPVGGVAVQARGGAWSKGGHASFDGTEPARRWLDRTGSGTIRWDGDTGLQYGSLACAHLYTLSGSQHYDVSTLACTGEIVRTYSGSGPGIGVSGYCLAAPVTPENWSCGCGTDYWCATLGVTSAVTATTLTKAPGAADVGWSGAHVVALSNEDTSDNAIARLMATSPDWTDGQTAIRTIPTAGITGVYRALRYRTQHTETAGSQVWVEGQWVDGAWVPGYYRTASTSTTYPTLTGLSPWGRYRVTVPLESRPVDEAGAPTGDGSWSSAGTRQHYFVADIEGVGGFDWQIIEPTAGYETSIGTPLVEAA